jgi:hypothetical protein
MNDLLARRRRSDTFLAWEDGLEVKDDIAGPRIVPITGGTIARQCFDAVAIFDVPSDTIGVTDCVANQNHHAARWSHRTDVPAEQTAIVAAVLDRDPTDPCSADACPSATRLSSGGHGTVPLATADQRRFFT